MRTITINRCDVNSALYPFLWESFCDDLDATLPPRPGTSDQPAYPDSLTIKAASVEAEFD